MARASTSGCYRYPLAAIVRQFSSWPKQIDLKAAMVPAETLPSNEGSATSFASTLLSKTLKACTRALTPEQDFESASYSSHETNGGSMKADKAVGAGFSTSVAGLFLDTSSGYSYWKAHSTAQQYCAARLRLDNTKSSAYTETDLMDNKSDALYSHAGRPGEVPGEAGGLTCFQRVCLQPIICRLSGRHVPTAGYAGKPLGFLRGGEVHFMQVQTRSYKTRMANRSTRDLKKRLLVQKFEMKRAHYKAICHDRSLPSQIRYDFALKLSKLPRNSSKTRLKNRCVFTGRSHSVYRKFGISRLVFRELALKGALTGVHKASW